MKSRSWGLQDVVNPLSSAIYTPSTSLPRDASSSTAPNACKVQLGSLRAARLPLFRANITHNVRYGRLYVSDEGVVSVMKKAHVLDAVMKPPDGYATTVGECGLMVSGRREAATCGGAHPAGGSTDFVH